MRLGPVRPRPGSPSPDGWWVRVSLREWGPCCESVCVSGCLVVTRTSTHIALMDHSRHSFALQLWVRKRWRCIWFILSLFDHPNMPAACTITLTNTNSIPSSANSPYDALALAAAAARVFCSAEASLAAALASEVAFLRSFSTRRFSSLASLAESRSACLRSCFSRFAACAFSFANAFCQRE